ncbi:MAG: dockerin type I domain-containing protein [Gordonibacter pamelaeae]
MRFDDLADGVYELTVSAPGFLSYRQQIEVKADAVSLELRTGDLLVNLEAAHPGVMLSGDATGDGVIDSADAAAIVDVLESSSYESSCDMDGDGSVTLADLQIAAANIGKGQIDATLARSVSAAAVKAEVNDGIKASSDPAELLAGASPVTFESQNPITESNPVVVDFDLAPNGDAACWSTAWLSACHRKARAPWSRAPCAWSSRTAPMKTSPSPSPIRVPLSSALGRRLPRQRSAMTAPSSSISAARSQLKKVTLTITKTLPGGANLAEISKVSNT